MYLSHSEMLKPSRKITVKINHNEYSELDHMSECCFRSEDHEGVK